MARYTTLIKAERSHGQVRQTLADVLAACELDLVYANDDYLVAKERPHRVHFNCLSTVEILINPPTLENPETRVNLVVHNQELPLKRDNHCQRLFSTVNQAIAATAL